MSSLPPARPESTPPPPARAHTLPSLALGTVLLVEGYASLGTEILALRRIAPWAGTSVDVTTVLLAAYLAALAGGYRRGGRLARDGDPRPRLAFRLSLAAALAAFWLSEPGIRLAFGLPLPPLAQAALYAVAGVAPVGWLLAECVLLAHACAPRADRSATAGRVFSLSTAGNVAGALLTTFLLLRFLGTGAAVLVLCAGLLAAALLTWRRSAPLPVACGAVAVLLSLDLWTEATVYVERNAYADYRLAALEDGGRGLVVNEQPASRHDAHGTGLPYIELIEATLCDARETRVLVLGAAGMTLGQGAPCALNPVFIDIDPAQERIAAEFLAVPAGAAGAFEARDARAFLRTDPGGWDAIVVDAYSNRRSMPSHLLTVEFYRLARSRLQQPAGSLYVNHVAYPDDALFLTRAERTLRSVFASCTVREAGPEPGTRWHAAEATPRNLIFRCPWSHLDADRTVYSDALPRADLDRTLLGGDRP